MQQYRSCNRKLGQRFIVSLYRCLLFPCLLGVGSAVDQIELSQLVSSCVNAQKRKEEKRKVRICSIANRPRLLVVPGTERQRPGWDLQLLAAHNRLANLFCWAPPAS